MSNDLKDAPIQGGISFKTPIFSFGNTIPDINSGFSFDLPLATIQSFADQALGFTSANSTQNRGFLTSTIESSQQQIKATNQQVTQIQQQSLSTLQKFSESLQEILTPAKGCFITSAICAVEGKADNCDELETLRHFRDDVMAQNPEWKSLIDEYYLVAPKIVQCIDRKANAAQIYLNLRDDYLIPAIDYVKRGQYSLAIDTYQDMVYYAASLVEGEM